METTTMKYHERIMYDKFSGWVSLFVRESGAVVTFVGDNGLEKTLEWYKDDKTGRPWIPKRKNFVSLVKQMIREGDLAR